MDLKSIASQATQFSAIGIMDSGVGGLSVLKHIHALLPYEHIHYYADSAYAPYGSKTELEIQQRCFAIADSLLEQSVKALVVACNTATAAAIQQLRARYTLPIIGMEPAVKPAVAATKNGIVGVLATTGTLKSAQFAALLENHGVQVKVITQACLGLVECIEKGELASAHTNALIKAYCAPLIEAGVDTIVLGCTHYPFVRHLIEAEVGEQVTVIETGPAVARRLQSVLAEHKLLNPSQQVANVSLSTSSHSAQTIQVLQQLWRS